MTGNVSFGVRGVVKAFLQGKQAAEIAEIRSDIEPGFGGVHPEPLQESCTLVSGQSARGWDIGIVTDGGCRPNRPQWMSGGISWTRIRLWPFR